MLYSNAVAGSIYRQNARAADRAEKPVNVLEKARNWAVEEGKVNEGGSRSAQGLTGRDFENYLNDTGGDGSFSVGGREFDGGVGNRWWEAKSGNYWDMLEDNPSMLAKFKSDMGNRLRIATDNGATYELFSNTPIPESIKQWLIEKGISFTELLD